MSRLHQFDICEVKGSGTRHVVVLQHGYLLDQATCVVAPVLPTDVYRKAGRLHPLVTIDDRPHLIAVELMLSIPRKSIGRPVDSAEPMADKIKSAMDFLFLGF